MTDVLWLCATGNHPVGIVKLYDEIEQRWKYYIGTGNGKDPAADVQMILAKGQKSYSLDHIMEFWEKDAVPVVRCKDCKYFHKVGNESSKGCAWGNCRKHSSPCIYANEFCSRGERRDS
jgi:hypothetical protein